MLVVRDAEGKVRAVWCSYACHCMTLAQQFAQRRLGRFAQSEIEGDFPGAIALMSAGCSADANPDARDTAEIANSQGRQLADEVKRLLTAPLRPVTAAPIAKISHIDLPFDTPRTREE